MRHKRAVRDRAARFEATAGGPLWASACSARRGLLGSLAITLLRCGHIQPAGVAAFEAIENFARFFDLSGLIVKDAQRGIASGPFGQQIRRRAPGARRPARFCPAGPRPGPAPTEFFRSREFARALSAESARRRRHRCRAAAPASAKDSTDRCRDCERWRREKFRLLFAVSPSATSMSPKQSERGVILLARGRNCLRGRECFLEYGLCGNRHRPDRTSRRRNRDWPSARPGNAGSRRRTDDSAPAARPRRFACGSRLR